MRPAKAGLVSVKIQALMGAGVVGGVCNALQSAENDAMRYFSAFARFA